MTRTLKRLLAYLAILLIASALGGCFYYPDDGYGYYGHYGYYGPPYHRGDDD